MRHMHSARAILIRSLPFWLYLALFKFGGGLHYTLLSPYGELFFPVWIVGALIGAASLVQLLLDVPGGYLLDRFGHVRMLKITTVAFLCAGLAFAFGLSQISFFISLTLAAFGWLFYGPGGSAYILSHATDAECGRYFALRDTFSSIGIVCASIALPFVLLSAPEVAGGILVALFGISLFLLYMVPGEKTPARPQTLLLPQGRRSVARIIRNMRRLNPASGMLILLTFSSAVFYGIIWFTVPLVIAKQQTDAGMMGLGLGVFDFSIVVLGYIIGSAVDRADKRALVFFGLLGFALFGALVGYEFGWLFILFGFLATTGDEAAAISLWSWMHHLDRDHTADGMISAIITFFEDLGWAIGPAIAGVLYVLAGPGLAISLGAVPLFIVWIIYYLFVHTHVPSTHGVTYALLPRRHPHRKHKA